MKILKKHNAILNETIYKQVHDSGLEIFYVPKAGFSKKYAFFGTKYGALYNKFEKGGITHDMPLGIAHFLEHKIFEDKEGNLFEKFGRMGASVNAYTNFVSTVYTFSAVDNFYPCLSLLLDFVQDLHLTDENVEKEKGIIAQEIKMYDDDPDWKVYFNALKGMYNVHPVKEDIAGTVESVYATTRADLETCYNSFYTPSNMFIIIVGDLETEKVFETVNEGLTSEYLSREKAPNLILPSEMKHISKPIMMENMETPSKQFFLGFKGKHETLSKEAYRTSIGIKMANDMLFGKSSELFKSLYESEMINSLLSYEYNYGRGFSHAMIGGEGENIEGVEKSILEAVEKMKGKGFNPVDFERMKKKSLGRFITAFNSNQSLASSFISLYIKNVDLFEYLNIVNSLSLDEVNGYFVEHFDTNNYVKSIIE